MARPRFGSDIGGYGIVPLWVIQRAQGSAVRVFGWLSGRYADRDKIAPSRKVLAAELGFSDIKAITEAMDLLETIGAITRIVVPGYPTELRLNYSKPENRGATPSEKTYGGSTKKRTTPVRKNVRHKDQEYLQESVQERLEGSDPHLPTYVNPKHRHRYGHFWCGEFFCVSEEQHQKFTQRAHAAGIDPTELDWPDWYTKHDQAWGETDIDHRDRKGPMFWLAVQLGQDLVGMHHE